MIVCEIVLIVIRVCDSGGQVCDSGGQVQSTQSGAECHQQLVTSTFSDKKYGKMASPEFLGRLRGEVSLSLGDVNTMSGKLRIASITKNQLNPL